MAENGKAKLIVTIIIGLFGVMSFGFALTVTDKYKSAREKASILEEKFEASKGELIKIPTLQQEAIAAKEETKGAREEMESLEEELDEATEELDELKSQVEEGGSDSGDSSEISANLDKANEQIALLTEENEVLKTEVQSDEKIIDELKANTAAPSNDSEELTTELENANNKIGSLMEDINNAEKIINELKAKAEESKEDAPKVNKATPAPKKNRVFVHKSEKEAAAPVSFVDKTDSNQIIKSHIDIINERIAELLTIASANQDVKRRIGVNAYSSKAKPDNSNIEKALNDIMVNYNNMYQAVCDCPEYSSYERGLAKSSLNKRVSQYISELITKNSSGEFNGTNKDVKSLLSKIQGEQKYFSN